MNPFIPDVVAGEAYSLYGVIVHRGSAGSGHYIAYIKHEDTWFEMNDRKATQMKAEQVLAQNAYMLFYQAEHSPPVLDQNFKVPKKRQRT
jgi:ubiquitin C-terminal hydrolase